MDMVTDEQAVLAPEGVEFESWYETAYPRLVAAVSVLAPDAEAARDAVAEACVRALERWKRVRRMANPTGWVYTVAVNVLRRQGRRFTLEQRTLRMETAPPPVSAPSAEAIAVRDAIRDLPEKTRNTVILRYFFDLTEPEIAEQLGVKRGTVAATLHAARNKLAEQLADGPNVSGSSSLSPVSGRLTPEADNV